MKPISGSDNNPDNLPTFDPVYSKVIGTMASQDVYVSREIKGMYIFGFMDKAAVIAYIIIEEEEIEPDTHKLRELWVHPLYRSKGLGSNLLLFLTRKLNKKLLLGAREAVSLDARAIIKKLLTVSKLKASDRLGVKLDPSLLDDILPNSAEVLLYEIYHDPELFGAKRKLLDGRSTLAEVNRVGSPEFN